MVQPPEILLDQMTGRSDQEFELETDLSLEERLERFEAAELGLLTAQAAKSRGLVNTDLTGDTKDVEEAIAILNDSAKFRASQITAQEFHYAQDQGLVADDVMGLLRDRMAELQATRDKAATGADYAELYRDQNLSDGSANELEAEQDIDSADDD